MFVCTVCSERNHCNVASKKKVINQSEHGTICMEKFVWTNGAPHQAWAKTK